MRFPYDDDNYYEHDNDREYQDEDPDEGQDQDEYPDEGQDQDEIIDQIMVDEAQNCDLEKTNNSYYIGSIFQDQTYAVLGLSVSARTFYNYDVNQINQYLYEFSNNVHIEPFINIIKLDILPDLTYACILKTHWLRLVQLHWQKTFALRKEILEKRKTIDAQHYFGLHGKYSDGLRVLPSINGLMKLYN